MPRAPSLPSSLPSSGKSSGSLYLVGTPLGNAGDFSPRAAQILTEADIILAEDTRTSRNLLTLYSIKPKKMLSYHTHNEASMTGKVIEWLQEGQKIALISDAGMPALADPGERLVAACHAAKLTVAAVPGPSAGITALALSGLPAVPHYFAGFLPATQTARIAVLQELARLPATLVFFEAPHRLAECLTDASQILGARQAAVVREISKKFEQCHNGTLATLAALFQAQEARGEIVLVVAPPEAETDNSDALINDLRDALAAHSLRDAVEIVAKAHNLPKKQVYATALELAKQR